MPINLVNRKNWIYVNIKVVQSQPWVTITKIQIHINNNYKLTKKLTKLQYETLW